MKKLIFSLLAVGLAGSLVADEKKVAAAKSKKCAEECKLAADAKCADKAGAFTKVAFKISNVGCEESCGKLTKTITALKGVKGQSVCAKSKTASIEYKSGETCSKTLHAALIKAGYKVEGQQIALKVKGVSCEVGAADLKAALTKLKGVESGEVCHVSGTTKVLFDPAKVGSKDIAAVIAKKGYSVEN